MLTKIFSALLSVTLVLGICPTVALADTDNDIDYGSEGISMDETSAADEGSVVTAETVEDASLTAYAKEVLATDDVAQDIVDAATATLINATDSLVYFDADKTALRLLIEQVEALDSGDYTTQSWEMLEEELELAKEVAANNDATQQEVDTTVMALQEAMDKLVFVSAISSNVWTNDYSVWSQTVKSYLNVTSAGNLERVEYISNKGLVVEEYDSDYMLLTRKIIDESTYAPSDLAVDSSVIWGGFLSGNEYNFVVSGQNNSDEDDSLAVVRVTKYNKDWTYVSNCEFTNINTTVPFEAGSLRMVEDDGTLVIRTSHKMYASSDGLNHQSNMTLCVDEDTMQRVGGYWDVSNIFNSYGYVSHSFNQFICLLNGTRYALDHGDGYPRAAALKKLGSSNSGSYVNLIEFAGSIGANYTYAAIGGLASSSSQNTLLCVGNSADQDLIASGTSGSSLCRNAWLTVTSADLTSTKTIWLTSYDPYGSDGATNPVLVKVNEDKFMITWGVSTGSSTYNGIRYVFVDGAGNYLSDVYTMPVSLSDCQPIVSGNKIIWYVTGKNTSSRVTSYTGPTFCEIDLDTYEPNKINLAYADISIKNSSYTYTGSAIEPDVSVTLMGNTLVENEDYILDYASNVNVGTASITITGIGNFTGTATSTFTINAKRLSSSGVTLDQTSYIYDGTNKTPSITVMDDSAVLTQDVDYTVTYSDNTVVGTATATITGIGNYTGTVSKTFRITVCSISAATVSGIETTYVYTGSDITPEPIVTINNNTLIKDEDYTVTYLNNKEIGKATITISGIGNYTGKLTINFTITSAVNTSDLEALVAQAELLNSSDYTQQSWAILQNALTSARSVLSNPSATQADVDAAADALQSAIDSLEHADSGVTVDKSALEAAISAAEKLNSSNYTESSWSLLEATLTLAKSVLDNASATQEVIDTTTDALNSAIAELIPVTTDVVDKAELEMTIKAAAQLDESEYTPDSWAALQEVLQAAQRIDADNTASQAEVNEVTDALLAAIDSLQKLFVDVSDPSAYYYEYVYYMAELGIITGYNETTFGVGDPMTRAQLVTIMWRYCEPDEYANYNEATAKNTSGLPDVPDATYYTEAVNWAVSEGVVTGKQLADGSYIFAPNDNISFDQMVTIMARYVLGFDSAGSYNDSVLSDSRFTDGAAVEDWARGSMSWAIDNDIVTGNDNHDGTYTISPLESVARERAATVLARSIQAGLIISN